MTNLFAVVLVAHGLIHLLGTAKALGADLPALRQPVTRSMGLVWLAGALLFIASAAALILWPRWWWALGIAAVAVSSVAIASSSGDAGYGAIVNGGAIVGVAFGFLASGPMSLRAAYDHDVERTLAVGEVLGVVTEAELTPLPVQVQRYLRVSGVVGRSRVSSVRVRMHGRIRSAPGAPWMPFTAEQHNAFDRPARFFYMNASRAMVPIQGLHRYVDDAATMRVKAAALVTVARAEGPDMTRAETVTFFNDMCLLAPATLIDARIAWTPVDDRTVRAAFTNAGHTIHAELRFNEDGELTDFWSDDRGRVSNQGGTLTPIRWSTPVSDRRTFGPYQLIAAGDARWHDASRIWSYIEITFDDIAFNVRAR